MDESSHFVVLISLELWLQMQFCFLCCFCLALPIAAPCWYCPQLLLVLIPLVSNREDQIMVGRPDIPVGIDCSPIHAWRRGTCFACLLILGNNDAIPQTSIRLSFAFFWGNKSFNEMLGWVFAQYGDRAIHSIRFDAEAASPHKKENPDNLPTAED